jgi:hypothetical protein
VRAHAAHPRPVVTEAAGELGQHGVVLDRAENTVEIVRHRGQVAARQLRAQRAGIEQGRGAAHEVERRQQVVKFDRARFALHFVDRQPHRHAHEERLWQLEAGIVMVNKVAVVQGLQPEIGKLVVALRFQRVAEVLQIELE